MALYFHYLYLFKRIQRKQAPQRVSFYMRDEMIRLERYQKQFKFLYSNGIEKMSQLENLKAEKEAEIAEINAQLKKLRSEVRLCKSIVVD